VKAVVPRDDYKLEIIFSNGEIGVFDCSPLLDFGVFKELRDISYFRQVRAAGGTIVWPHEQALSPRSPSAAAKRRRQAAQEIPMSLGFFKISATLISIFLIVVTWFLFTAVCDIGSAYLMQWKPTALFPDLTQDVALPLLRIGPHDPHERPVTQMWVWAVWMALMMIPAATAGSVLFSRSLEVANSRFSLGIITFATLLFGVVSVIVVGLAVPYA
jgi:hypothetical protein